MQRIQGDRRLCCTDMVDSEVTCGCQRAEFWQQIDSAQPEFYAPHRDVTC
jgi:hypothetical protein